MPGVLLYKSESHLISTQMSSNLEQIPPSVQLVAQAFDQICDEYEKNNMVIFQNESERARKYFSAVNRGRKSWSKLQQCMVPGCGQKSIARSHTVPKSMSLRVIGEGGHVFVPSFDEKRGGLKVEKVGVADATTFPGFCVTHELLFSRFENKGVIDQEPDVYLQIYRAACRELFRARFVVEQHDRTIAEYSKARDDGFVRLIQERARALGIGDAVNLASLKFESDPLVDSAIECVAPVRELIKYMEQRVLPTLERAVFHGDGSGIAVIAASIDFEIPVALAGSGSFGMAENGVERSVSLLMNVVPQSSSTLIVMATLAQDRRYLEAYAARWTSHALRILSMVESWMVNGTDQWCIRPSTWKKIPPHRTTALLADLLGARKNVGEECDASIFDDLRNKFILASDVENAENMTPEYVEFIASERQKMA